LFLIIFVNLNAFLFTWSNEVQLIVYLDDNISAKDRQVLEKRISQNPDLKSISYVSRDMAWESFKNTFSARTDFLKSLDFNPLPASYNLQFKQSPERVDKIRKFAEEIRKSSGVESLEFGEKWIARFENFMIFLRVFLLAVGGFLGLGLIFIVSNTIKLSVYSRQDEIELMLMVGATHGYIKTPFLLEGIAQGFAGALISLVLIKLIHIQMKLQFQETLESIIHGGDFLFISPFYVFLIFLVSILVGMLGSYFSINQFLTSRIKK
ncbi:MAG: hypothetical protein A3K09_00005, partial [Nitrospinae bacterium RIFCSPLOWO2_12_FULL_47_7]